MSSVVSKTRLCVDVAVPLPVYGLFTYLVPDEFKDKVKTGVRVHVPFRNREIVAYVIGVKEEAAQVSLKPILSVLDEEPVIASSLLALTSWISHQYGASWGEAIENALPRWVKYGKKAERALAKEKEEEFVEPAEKPAYQLTPDQEQAYSRIMTSLDEVKPKAILLFGVTGSGKTELYIRAIHEILSRKKAAIVLVPEIALTEQIRRFFYHHFGDNLEVLHSKLNDTEKFLAWKRIESGRKNVILGPRSAIFAPVKDLGLIVMDEEHETSYKQETVPRYHAREVAAWRAQEENALFIMGSATPSLESMKKANEGVYQRIDLPNRVDDKPLPEVVVLDMKESASGRGRRGILSGRLVSEIEMNLERKEGIMLLLNRRGFSTNIYNSQTGEIKNCPSCQISLTYHQEEDVLMCHYCFYKKPIKELTKSDEGTYLKFRGFGTEKIESDVALRWPNAKIARLDTDSIRKKGSHEKILKDFRDQKIDILIGTQMIAKGFDFPHVTLVGVVLADVGLMLPDFRSSERTFQLLTQVAGRAGRGEKKGRVFIQTYSPNHPSVFYSKEHDYTNFYDQEIKSRNEYDYPPYSKLVNFIIRSRDENAAYIYARDFRDQLKRELGQEDDLFGGDKPKVTIVGPSPLPFYKLRGHFRWHVMIKFPQGYDSYEKLWQLIPKLKKTSRVKLAVDVDPLNIL